MGFLFGSHHYSTDKKVETEVRDYGDRVQYPVHLNFHVSTGDGYMTIGFSFYTRESARQTITELVGKCNGWLADELGIPRQPPPPEEVWPEAEEETLSTARLQAAHKALSDILEPDGRGE